MEASADRTMVMVKQDFWVGTYNCFLNKLEARQVWRMKMCGKKEINSFYRWCVVYVSNFPLSRVWSWYWEQLGSKKMSKDVEGCLHALKSRDAADTSRIPAAAVVCCTSRLISDARRQRSTRCSPVCYVRVSADTSLVTRHPPQPRCQLLPIPHPTMIRW